MAGISSDFMERFANEMFEKTQAEIDRKAIEISRRAIESYWQKYFAGLVEEPANA